MKNLLGIQLEPGYVVVVRSEYDYSEKEDLVIFPYANQELGYVNYHDSFNSGGIEEIDETMILEIRKQPIDRARMSSGELIWTVYKQK